MILSVPAIVKVLLVFALILTLNRVRLSLSLSLVAGSLVLGFWMNLGPVEVAGSILESLAKLQTIGLILIVGFILVLSRLMQEGRHLDRIVAGFLSLSRDDRTAGAVLPALIGLLPMPGGALFSAPMVETALCRNPMTGEQRTAVNYWFRHIWEYWWPLYPGVVLAVALLRVEPWLFMAVMAPMTVVTVLAGVVFILKPLGPGAVREQAGFSWAGLKGFLWEIMPILTVILVLLGMAGVIGILNRAGVPWKIPGAVSILPGLLAAIVWVMLVNRLSFGQLKAAVVDRKNVSLLLLVAAIMIFEGLMTDSRAVVEIRNELMAYRIPLVLVITLMPFLSGVVTGIAIGFVGASFPLIIPLFPAGSLFDTLSYAALAYSFGYMGMMLSPVHLCFLVTKDYFRASLLGSYRYFYLSALSVMVGAVVLFLISRIL